MTEMNTIAKKDTIAREENNVNENITNDNAGDGTFDLNTKIVATFPETDEPKKSSKDSVEKLKLKIKKLQKEKKQLIKENQNLIDGNKILEEKNKNLDNFIQTEQKNVIDKMYADKVTAETKLRELTQELSVLLDTLNNTLEIGRHALQYVLTKKGYSQKGKDE